jgi:hypothetical protein
MVTGAVGADSVACATKVAVVAPAAMVRVGGTVTLTELLVSVTTLPPVGAAPVRVTVQVALLPATRVSEAHPRVLIWTPEATVS